MIGLLKFALKNILRRRIRTLLTIGGISIGIATIVTLGILAAGIQHSMGRVLMPAGVDLTITEAGVGDLIMSRITTEQLQKIQTIEGVETAFGQLISVTRTDISPFFMIFGMHRQDLKIAGFEIVEGRDFADGSNEVIMGRMAATNFNKEVGDNIVLGIRIHKIVGIYESGNPMQDGGAVLPIDVLWANNNEAREFTMVLVDVADAVDVGGLGQKIEEVFDGEVIALSSIAELGKIDQGMEIINFAVYAISLLAIVIGGIGAMNTIMMSVFERTREIGILRAVGWSRKRVFAMILNESIIIGICATVIGVLLGILVIAFIMTFPTAKALIQPVYSEVIFVIAVIVGILVSVIGGTYPAIRATKFAPTEALRYE